MRAPCAAASARCARPQARAAHMLCAAHMARAYRAHGARRVRVRGVRCAHALAHSLALGATRDELAAHSCIGARLVLAAHARQLETPAAHYGSCTWRSCLSGWVSAGSRMGGYQRQPQRLLALGK
eukprot:5477471-Prymnesium_polylepis.1